MSLLEWICGCSHDWTKFRKAKIDIFQKPTHVKGKNGSILYIEANIEDNPTVKFLIKEIYLCEDIYDMFCAKCEKHDLRATNWLVEQNKIVHDVLDTLKKEKQIIARAKELL
tara:strand:- start:2020 stop:2355 length:336 start_codon:yes stop_codon:yes gene_type:complete